MTETQKPHSAACARSASPRVVILTGAGISRESGLATFRDTDGTWNKVRIEDVATPEAFERDPELVQDFYNARRAQLSEVHPNAAHEALARLERERPGDSVIVTQNVDDLHERAGSTSLIHMHGELNKARCTACRAVLDWTGSLFTDSVCPSCGQEGFLRPHIVWFGEMPFDMNRIWDLLANCDMFVSIGTSGTVYPAAAFVQEAANHGAKTVELNLEPSHGASCFEITRYGPAATIVPAFVDDFLNDRV